MLAASLILRKKNSLMRLVFIFFPQRKELFSLEEGVILELWMRLETAPHFLSHFTTVAYLVDCRAAWTFMRRHLLFMCQIKQQSHIQCRFKETFWLLIMIVYESFMFFFVIRSLKLISNWKAVLLQINSLEITVESYRPCTGNPESHLLSNPRWQTLL